MSPLGHGAQGLGDHPQQLLILGAPVLGQGQFQGFGMREFRGFTEPAVEGIEAIHHSLDHFLDDGDR